MKEQLFLTVEVTNNPLLFTQQDRYDLTRLYKDRMNTVLHGIKDSVEKLTPVRTGALKAGYRISTTGEFPKISGGIYNTMSYFEPVEFGRDTSKKSKSKITMNAGSVKLTTLTQGKHMLQKSIVQHADELEELSESFQDDFLALLNSKT